MSKEDGKINIQPIEGEAMRFICESWSAKHAPHMVDLSKNYGNGVCSCADYIARRGPAIRQGAELFTRATSCRHLIAVRKFWAMNTLRDIAEIIAKNEAKPTKTTRPYSGYC
jgi:hypothetical protein